MRPRDGAVECLLPLPWLGASWWFAGAGLWVAALACSYLFFLVALRLDAAVPELMAQAGRVLG